MSINANDWATHVWLELAPLPDDVQFPGAPEEVGKILAKLAELGSEHVRLTDRLIAMRGSTEQTWAKDQDAEDNSEARLAGGKNPKTDSTKHRDALDASARAAEADLEGVRVAQTKCQAKIVALLVADADRWRTWHEGWLAEGLAAADQWLDLLSNFVRERSRVLITHDAIAAAVATGQLSYERGTLVSERAALDGIDAIRAALT